MAITNISDLNQQQADKLGISLSDYQQLLAQNPPVYQAYNQGSQYGNFSGGQYMQSPGMANAVQTLGLINKYGGGGGNKPVQATQNVVPVSGLTQDAATNLGAAALGQLGLSGPMGAYAVYNPTPGQIPQGKAGQGGVSKVASPSTSSTIPEVQGGGLGVSGIFNAAPSAGGSTTPDASGQLPGTPTAVMPANAPGAGRPAMPFASAPPAPGASATSPLAQPGQPPAAPTPPGAGIPDYAHQSGLINAGKAMFAHLTGGDPSTASDEDIQNFHSQLTDHIGTALGPAPQAVQNYTAGATPATPPAAPAPTKMATGGMVPGRGNRDIVPALLTPGEYVIPKQQAAQIFGGREPIRMADGGTVPTPREARHKSVVPGAPQSPTTSAPQQPTQGQDQSSSSSDKGGQGGNQDFWHWSNIVKQAQAAQADRQFAGIGTGAYSAPAGSSALTVGDVANGAAVPNAGQTQDLGQMGGGAAGGVAAGADVASGLMSALQTAVNKYKDSIKDFIPRAQAFGNNSPPQYQTPTFQQEEA